MTFVRRGSLGGADSWNGLCRGLKTADPDTHPDTLEEFDSGPGHDHHVGDHAKGPGGPPPPRHMDTPTPWKAQEAEHGAGHREDDEADAERAREDPGPDGGDSEEDAAQRDDTASDREEDGERARPVAEGRGGDLHGRDPREDQDLDQREADEQEYPRREHRHKAHKAEGAALRALPEVDGRPAGHDEQATQQHDECHRIVQSAGDRRSGIALRGQQVAGRDQYRPGDERHRRYPVENHLRHVDPSIGGLA